jgi:hypothetical protein
MIRLRGAVQGAVRRWPALVCGVLAASTVAGCAGAVGEDWKSDDLESSEPGPDETKDDADDQPTGGSTSNDDSDDTSDEQETDVGPDATNTGGQPSVAPTSGATGDTQTQNTGGGTGTAPNSQAAMIPARIRRLSNVEYGNAVRALLGTTESYEDDLPADVRQRNFTVNQAQTVSSDWNAEVERLAKAAAEALVASDGLNRLSPCAGQATDSCAEQFIDSLGKKAFRRDVAAEEHTDLLAIYQQGSAEAGFDRGMELVVAAILQAPSFIYLSELGQQGATTTTLTGEEIASLLAFVTTQAPPDETLLEAGRQGSLADPEQRAQQAQRLLSTESGKKTLETMALQWFTADWVLDAGKDNIPEFNERRTQLFEESRNFVRTVIDSHNADARALLTADFTVVAPEVAGYYGLSGSGQVSLAGTPRLGIVTQASFLGGHSSPTQSSPVKRGAAFLRQVLCFDPPDPSTVDLVVAAPQPDPSKSTRQLFEAHSADATCQSCHQLIDPIGFAFEQFDEGGRVRTGPEDNNGHPIETAGSVSLAGEDFVFDDAADFIRQVADSELGQACVARTATRYAFAWSNTATELAFVEQWKQMDPASRTQLTQVLTKLIASDLFVQRKAM